MAEYLGSRWQWLVEHSYYAAIVVSFIGAALFACLLVCWIVDAVDSSRKHKQGLADDRVEDSVVETRANLSRSLDALTEEVKALAAAIREERHNE